MNKALQNFITLGHHPDDPEEEKLRKSSLLVMSGPFAIAGLLWGILYFANGLTIPGMIPFNYGLLSIASILYFIKTKKYVFFRNSQLVLILLLPFLLQTSLGGFVPGSAVIFWASITPAGALVFQGKKYARYWFLAFVVLVLIAYLLNDLLPQYIDWNLDAGFIDALFLMNIIGVSALVFMIQYYFVEKQTELKEAIEEKNHALELQSQQLQELDEIKSRFFANISHEFRTPLTLILGLINKQMAEPDVLPAPQDQATLKRNASRLLQLINQLLDLSKLESGELTLQTTRTDLVLYCKNLLAQFESMAHAKDIEILFMGHPVIEPVQHTEIPLYVDVEKLQKILSNLFSNAVKFTPAQGHIQVEIQTVSADDEQEDAYVSIQVINTGPGIPAEKLPYIFDRFYQVDGASNREFEGTGIGLALVKELVELHQGTVRVESDAARTLFEILLPLSDAYLQESEKKERALGAPLADHAEIWETQVSAPADSHMGAEHLHEGETEERLQVLIVEDNQDLRVFIKEILKQDFQVLEAVDGRDGFQQAQAHIPDLIVSDVMMPHMDGYQLCKELKELNSTNHIPVVLLTAKAGREDKLEGLELGADDYLVKPFDEEELRLRIKNLIKIREQLQKKYQQEVWLKPKTVEVASVHQKFLAQVKEAIEQNLDNSQFGVEDLGKEVGMSRSQLHRKLKALTDQSASNFVRNYRLHRAAELLQQGAGNITEIAYQVGFSSQSYFSSSFQSLFACSPSEYKNISYES